MVVMKGNNMYKIKDGSIFKTNDYLTTIGDLRKAKSGLIVKRDKSVKEFNDKIKSIQQGIDLYETNIKKSNEVL